MKKLILSTVLFVATCININAQSLNFDGSNDYVTVGNVLTPSYTKEAWIYMIGNTGSNNVVSGGGDGMHAFWVPGQTLSAGHNGNWSTVQDNTTLNLNQWYHIAVSYDAVAQIMTLYKNGIVVSQATGVVGYNGGNMVRLGAYDNAANLFNGTIDEVRIWNTVRTSAQIQNDMNCTFASAQTGLIVNYNFNEGVPNGNNAGITTLNDLSGNVNDGILNNFALTGTTSNWVDDVPTLNPVPTLTINAGITSACAGTSVTFTATSTNGGATPVYQWTKNGTNVGTDSVGYTDNSLVSTDVISCMMVSGIPCALPSSVTSNTLSINIPSMTVSPTTSICSGNNTTLTASGLSSYTWSANAGSATTSTVNVSPNSTDTYTVTGTDGTCVVTDTIRVNVTTTPTVSFSGNTSICSGVTTTLTATGASSYTWTSGSSTVTTNSIAIHPSSTKTVSLTGANGACTNSTVVTVSVTTTPNVTVSSPGNICIGNSTTLTANGATSYTWSPNATGANTSSITISPTISDTYTVTGANGICTDTQTITVNVYNTPTVSVTSATICAGSTATLTASGSATSYTWNTTQTGSSITITPSSSSNFTVTGEDLNGCMATAVGSVSVNPIPSISISNPSSPSICAGNSATLTASGTATSFTWDTGENSTSIVVTPTSSSNYSVTGTDVNGCTNSASSSLGVNSLPTVSATGDNICMGSTGTLTVSGTATSYSWSTGATGTSISPTTTVTTGYTVTGTDANNCTNSATATLTINALPSVSVNNPTICAGASAILTATGSATTYSWSTTETGSSITSTVTATTNYTVTGTDANNCTNFAISTVTVNDLPSISTTGASACAGSTATLTVTGTAITYTWNTGENTTTITPTATTTTNYTVTGTDANNCSNTAVATLTVNALPVILVTGTTGCMGSTATLTASGASTYTWSTNENTASISPTSTATTTDYTVTGTGANNCVNSTVATLTLNPRPTILVNSPTICAGSTATLTASGASTYNWNTGSNTASISPTPTATTTDYTVTGTSPNNCKDSAVATVTVKPLPNNSVTNNGNILTAANLNATYQWIDCSNHTAMSAQTNQSFTATVTGSYQVMLTENGCMDTSTCQMVTVTGINKFVNDANISVYPNPATDIFYLQTSTNFDNASVEVYDMIGQKVMEEKLTSTSTRLNLGILNNAVYQIRVLSNNTLIYQTKVVKQQ